MIQKLLYSILFVFSISNAVAMDCPVDIGPDIDACEGETIILNADTGDSGDTYVWFKDAVEISGETMPTLSVTTGGTYTVEVSDGSATCTDEVMVAFSLLPIAIDPTPLYACDPNNDGFTSFALNSKNDEITNGEIGVEVTYHGTLLDAEDGLNALISPYLNDVPYFETVYARVVNPASSCYQIVTLDLIVNDSPELGIPDDLTLVDDNGDGFETFDLTQNETAILNGLNPIDYDIQYFTVLEDAQMYVNPIATPTMFVNTSNPQNIFARVDDLDLGCYSITTFALIAGEADDSDDDGVFDAFEDINGNGDLTDDDTDADGTPNYLDEDDDGDLVPTITEITGIGAGFGPNSYEFIDTDSDSIENYLDDDDDGDGVLTVDEDYNDNGNPLDDDTNTNGIPDFLDMSVALGIDDILSNTITVYPNPTDEKLYIEGVDTVISSISIFTIEGKRVQHFHNLSEEGTTLDVSTLPKAIYFVKVESQGNTQTFKVVKQ